MQKKNSARKAISVLCGGQSTEHEISILSAQNVVAALDANRYLVSIIYISQTGHWYWSDDLTQFCAHDPIYLVEKNSAQPIYLAPGQPKQPWVLQNGARTPIDCDCVIPILHGTLGEDGAPQGLFEMLNVPYVGANVAASVLCMEKHIAKRLLRYAQIPTADWVTLNKYQLDNHHFEAIVANLGSVFFIKPVRLGSSVAVSKVTNEVQFKRALELAFQYDEDVIAERAIEGREIELSVLGNAQLQVTAPGEIVTHYSFYSYRAKYLDPDGAQVIVPADLPDDVIEKAQGIALRAYQALQCEGMARVDCFVTAKGDVIVNELNTIPGFTNISMYPKNWQVAGKSCAQLFDELIALACNRYERRKKITAKLARVHIEENADYIQEDSA